MIDNYNLCKIHTTGSYIPLLDTRPRLKKVSLGTWDLFVSTLSYYVCMGSVKNLELSIEEQEKNFANDCKKFCKDFPDFVAALQNLIEFMKQRKTKEDPSIDMGFWLACNLFNKVGAELSKDELEIGLLAARTTIITIQSSLN